MIVDGLSGSLGDFLYTRQQPKFVFNAYMYALGSQEIADTDYNQNNINVSVVSNSIADEIKPLISAYDATYGDITDVAGDNLIDTQISLTETYLGSTNNDTTEAATISYENMLNTPCSALLANPKIYKDNIAESIVSNDSEYKIWAADKTDKFAARHMRLTYAFESKYNESEYEALNVTENYITENGVYIAADDFVNSVTTKQSYGSSDQELQGLDSNGIMTKGCMGVLLSYRDGSHTGRKMIPMMYYEFEKPVYSNKNNLNIEWNTNGILRVE